jgi:hypothetical protein
MCTAVLIGGDPATPSLPPHLDSYYERTIGEQRQTSSLCNPLCDENYWKKRYGTGDKYNRHWIFYIFSQGTFYLVLGIRIRRIRCFLDLPDPDSLVRGTDQDPAPDPSLFS